MAKTLRQFANIPDINTLEASKTALVLIDFQMEYFKGSLPLRDGPLAVKNAAKLVEWAEQKKILIIHVHHIADEKSPLFANKTERVKTHPLLPVKKNHLHFEKNMPSAFINPEFNQTLNYHNTEILVVAGLMTHMCVDTTTRGAAHFNYKVIVAADACATRDLPTFDGKIISHKDVHEVSLAALQDRFATILTAEQIIQL